MLRVLNVGGTLHATPVTTCIPAEGIAEVHLWVCSLCNAWPFTLRHLGVREIVEVCKDVRVHDWLFHKTWKVMDSWTPGLLSLTWESHEALAVLVRAWPPLEQ